MDGQVQSDCQGHRRERGHRAPCRTTSSGFIRPRLQPVPVPNAHGPFLSMITSPRDPWNPLPSPAHRHSVVGQWPWGVPPARGACCLTYRDCRGLIGPLPPTIPMLRFSLPAPQNAAYLEIGVWQIQVVKMGSLWVASLQQAWCPYNKRGHLDPETGMCTGRTPHECGGRDG